VANEKQYYDYESNLRKWEFVGHYTPSCMAKNYKIWLDKLNQKLIVQVAICV